MIFYCNWVPRRFDGYTVAFVSFIRPSHRDDVGLHAHEKMHQHQFWRTWCMYGFMRLFSKRCRLQFEVEAYREQLKYSPGDEGLFARYLSENYGLDIDIDQARKLLTAS